MSSRDHGRSQERDISRHAPKGVSSLVLGFLIRPISHTALRISVSFHMSIVSSAESLVVYEGSIGNIAKLDEHTHPHDAMEGLEEYPSAQQVSYSSWRGGCVKVNMLGCR